MLATRSSVAVRPVRVSAVRVAPRVVRVRAQPEQALKQAIEKAEEICEGGDTAECAAAWDNVEELSSAIAHKKATDAAIAANDPLEKFCGENPDADECRVYDD